MKKFLTLLLAMAAIPVMAKDFTYDGIIYTVIDETDHLVETKAGQKITTEDDKTDYIPGNTTTNSLLSIPEKVKDGDIEYTVTRVGDYSFCQQTDIEILLLPNTLTELGEGAFFSCFKLALTAVPDNVKCIGEYSFMGCLSLAYIGLPANLEKIDTAAFSVCLNLKTITLPESMTDIEMGAFMGSGLTSIVIPDKVTFIGSMAFSNCTNLLSVTLPKELFLLGLQTFDQSTSLTDFYYYTDSPGIAFDNSFCQDNYNRATLHVLPGMKQTMETQTPWKSFKNIVEDTSGIDSITEDAEYSPVYYDMNGVIITNPSKGQILIRQIGNKVEKIVY